VFFLKQKEIPLNSEALAELYRLTNHAKESSM